MKEFVLEILRMAKPWFLGMIPAGISWLISFLINEKSDVTIFFMTITLILGIIVMVYLMIIILPCMCGLIGTSVGKILRKGLQIDKKDFEREKEYYREILDNNTPLILGYIDNLEFDKRDLIAEILFFIKKDIIKIEDGVLKKNEDLAHCDLKDSEQKILENIDSGKLAMSKDSFLELRNLVSSEAESLGLVCKKKLKTKKRNRKEESVLRDIILPGIFGIALFVVGIIGIFVEQVLHILLLCILVIIILPIILLFVGVPLIGGYQSGLGKLYKKTAKGNEVKRKLKGLEFFLKDYSRIDEREAKEVKLWDDYLVYSVMFGQNKKVTEDIEKYIEII